MNDHTFAFSIAAFITYAYLTRLSEIALNTLVNEQSCDKTQNREREEEERIKKPQSEMGGVKKRNTKKSNMTYMFSSFI